MGHQTTAIATGEHAISLLTRHTGVVIPVYFRTDTDPAFARMLLRETVAMFVHHLGAPSRICLSVDGSELGETVARETSSAFGTEVVVSAQNLGKLAAARRGSLRLLADEAVQYLAVADQDGDHFANELLNFLRTAKHVQVAQRTDRVIVLGNRRSRHRPLGFLRAEQEELANRVLLDALHYVAARSDQPLNLQYTTSLDPVPDFHSGYKLFSRAVAERVFTDEPDLAGCEEIAYYRHACEAVMVVEALDHGAILATVNRTTFNEQPISLFADFDRSRLAADMIVWPCRRLNIPAEFAVQWLHNHLPALLLDTLLPQGRDELATIASLVHAAFDTPRSTDTLTGRPRFV